MGTGVIVGSQLQGEAGEKTEVGGTRGEGASTTLPILCLHPLYRQRVCAA